MQPNKISGTISQQDLDEVMAANALIRSKLPFLISLSSDEIKALVKMGDKGRVFASKALDIAQRNPDIIPRGFDIEEFQRDMDLFQMLDPIRRALIETLQLVESTQTLVGCDNMLSSLIIYNLIKNNPLGAALADAADDLGRRFVQKVKAKPDEPAKP